MISRLAILVLASFPFLTSRASSNNDVPQFWSGNSLYEWCTKDAVQGAPNSPACRMYIVGAADTWIALQSNGSLSCYFKLPQTVTMTQLEGIVVKYLRDNPEKRHVAGYWIVQQALTAAFPCGR